MATTDERKSTLEMGVDPSGAKDGFAAIKAGATDMAAGVAAAGERAAAGLQGIGDAGEKTSTKIDRQTSNMVRQMQSYAAALESGGTRTAAYFEKMAQIKGLDPAVTGPWIAYLKEQEARQLAVNTATAAGTAQMGQYGMSAKATAAALRGIGPQFTDIVTSLSSGQAPMTVLIQQGGQLKDMFGGIGPAAKALGGYITGLINPLTLGAAAVGVIGYAMVAGRQESEAYNKALILSGNAAGTTAAQLQASAVAISAVVGTQGAAAEALAAMAGSGAVASQNLEAFATTAVRMERAVGQSVADTVKQFTELGRAPVEASVKLNEQYHYLTASVYEQIKALQEQGNTVAAATLAQQTFATAMDGVSQRVVDNAGIMERAWTGVKDGAKAAWDAMLGVGRKDTLAQQLANVQGQIAAAQGQDANRKFSLPWDTDLSTLKQREAALQEQVRLEKRGAEEAANRARATQATVDYLKLSEQYLSKSARLNAEITKITVTAVAAGRSQAEIDKLVAAAREKAADKASTAGQSELASIKARVVAAQEYLERLKAQGLESDKLTEGEKLVLKIQEDLKGKLDAKTRALKEQELVQANLLASVEKETNAYDRRLKLLKDLDKQQAKILDDAFKAADKTAEQADKQDALNATFGLGRVALEELTLAQLKKSRADLEATETVIPGYITALDQQIAAQERFVASLQKGETLTAGQKAAEAAAQAAADASEAWRKSAEQIQQSLTDALVGAFGTGKSYAKSLADAIKGYFSTMVLKPVINMVINPIAGVATTALGLPNLASAATGASGLSGAGSLFSLGGSLGAFGGAASSVAAGVYGGIGELSSLSLAEAITGGLGAVMEGSLAAGFGTLAGALGPVALGLAAVYQIAKSLDHSGTPHTGAGSYYSAATGLQQASAGTVFNSGFTGIGYSASAEQMTSGLVQSIVSILDTTATSFGKAAGFEAAASFADDSSRDGAWGSLFIKNLQGVLVDWQAGGQSFRTFSDGNAGSTEWLAAISADVRTVLDGLDLPDWAQKTLDKLGNAPSLDQLAGAVAEITRVQNAIVAQRSGLQQQLDLLSGVTTQREIERNALDESNRALYDQIKALEDQKTAAEAAAEAARAVAAERAGLQQQLDLLTGVTTQREIERNALNESNRALYDQIKALEDSKAAVEAQAVRVQALAEAERALAAERAGLMDQIWQATNQTAQIRAKQLAGLDPSNRPIQQALYDIADAQTAFNALQTSVQTERDRLTREFEAKKSDLQQAAGSADFGYLQDQLDASKSAVKAELDIKRQGYADQISAAQDARSEMQRIADALAGSMRAVRIEGDAFEQASLQAARQTIADAARAGNVRAAGLDAAIGVATGTDSARFYSTFSAYAIAQAKTAADIGKLAGAAQSQVSSYDQTIAAIQASDALAQTLADAQLAAMQAQYELDLSAAQTQVALAAESNAAQLAALQAQYEIDIAALDKTSADAKAQLDALLGIDTSVQGVTAAMEAFSAAILGAMDAVARVAATDAAAQTAAAIGAAQASSAAALLSGVPQFASGTNYVPRDMLALVHQGEAIVPAAYNPPTAGNGSVNAELVAELRALRAEVAELRQSSERSAIEAKRGSDALQGQQRVPILVQVVS